MKYVYLIRGLSHPEQRYAGLTQIYVKASRAARRPLHPYREIHPWELITYVAFSDEKKGCGIRQQAFLVRQG